MMYVEGFYDYDPVTGIYQKELDGIGSGMRAVEQQRDAVAKELRMLMLMSNSPLWSHSDSRRYDELKDAYVSLTDRLDTHHQYFHATDPCSCGTKCADFKLPKAGPSVSAGDSFPVHEIGSRQAFYSTDLYYRNGQYVGYYPTVSAEGDPLPIKYTPGELKGVSGRFDPWGNFFYEYKGSTHCVNKNFMDEFINPEEAEKCELYFEVTGRPTTNGTMDHYSRWDYADWREEYLATGQSFAFDKMMERYDGSEPVTKAVNKTSPWSAVRNFVSDHPSLLVLLLIATIVAAVML